MWGNTQEQTYTSPINSGANLYNALIGAQSGAVGSPLGTQLLGLSTAQPVVTNDRYYPPAPTYPANTNPVEYGSAVGHYPDEQVNPTYSANTNPVEYGSAVGHYPEEMPTVTEQSSVSEPLGYVSSIGFNPQTSTAPTSSTSTIDNLAGGSLQMGQNLGFASSPTLGLRAKALGLPTLTTAHIKAGVPNSPKARQAPQVRQAPAMMMSSGPQLRVVTGPNGEQSLAYSANHMYNQASLDERRLNELRRQQVLDFLAGKGMTYDQALAQARGY